MKQALSADLESLLPFATASQARDIAAWIRLGTSDKAAKELGVTGQTVRGSVAAARRKAAERNHAPEFGRSPPRSPVLPETERIKGVSTLRNGDGSIASEWTKTEGATIDQEKNVIDAPIVKQAAFTDGRGDVRALWTTRKPEQQQQINNVIEGLRLHLQEYHAPARRVIRGRSHVGLSRGLLEVYVLGDPHVGLLTWAPETGSDFDLKIVETELCAAVDLAVERSAPASRALLINVGDYFHANDDTQLTPGHKHKLSVDSRVPKIFRVGFGIQCRMVQRMLEVHDHVTVWNVGGNHDPLLALMLNFTMQERYREEPRVTVPDNFEHYPHMKFGKNLIAAAHGHLAPMKELGGIMATDWPEEWGQTEYRRWFCGHRHSEAVVEGMGFVAEQFNTMAARDDFNSGRYRAARSMKVLTLHETYGLISRREVDRKLAMARLDGVL
jgi:hypothetical protein